MTYNNFSGEPEQVIELTDGASALICVIMIVLLNCKYALDLNFVLPEIL